jgi:hypothetical protein
MTDNICAFSQKNFDPNHLPPGSADFYNTQGFAVQEINCLSNLIKEEDRILVNGLHAIKDAIKDAI